MGFVDFEKVQGIQGIVMVNTVDNWEEVDKSWFADKKVTTSISFDDGRTFQPLKVGEKDLHLHSVTDAHNSGKVFSSPAPGIVMGVGNTGEYLKEYKAGDLYVSDDAGVTWTKALDEANMYEFGDQGAVLVAINNEEATDKVRYSINHGKDWETFKLEDKVRAQMLTTVPDSTSLKFILLATRGAGSKLEHHVYSFNFEGLHERKCKESDFEKWSARINADGKPSCLMGHTQSYRRRKADADCFVGEEFRDPEPLFENCVCADQDFECDYNFVRSEDRKECVPVGPVQPPEGACTNIADTFMGTSGWRLIPGNTCTRKGGVKKDEPVERSCKDSIKPPASGRITSEVTPFHAGSFKEYYYLERTESSRGEDET
ncbi:vacuolar protein sorting/targeting protein PEP1, partial [Cryomyces antarcticus]